MSIEQSVKSIISGFEFSINEDKLKNIPDLNIKENTDMRRILSEVMNINVQIDPNASDEEVVAIVLKAIEEKLFMENNPTLEEITKISNKFALEIENSFGTLADTITAVVKQLQDQIKEKYTQLMKREGADALLVEASPTTEDDFRIIKWEGLNSLTDQNEIITEACINSDIKNNDLNAFNLSVVLNKLIDRSMILVDDDSGVYSQDLKVKVPFTEEKIKEIQEEIKNYYKTTDGEKDNFVDLCLKLILNGRYYVEYFNIIISKMRDPKQTANLCIELISFCNEYNSFYEKIKKDSFNISDKLTEESFKLVKDNSNSVMKSVYGCMYWCLFQKLIGFEGRLILSNDIINNDVYEKFIESGKTIEDLSNYIKAFHKILDVPLKGVELATVLAADVNTRLQKENLKLEMDAKIIKSRCLNLAYSFVCKEYSKPILEDIRINNNLQLSYYENKIDRAIKIAQGALHGELEKVEDNLFYFITHSFYENTLVFTLYKALGKEYIEISKKASSIGAEDILTANTKTAIDLILNYLINKLCD